MLPRSLKGAAEKLSAPVGMVQDSLRQHQALRYTAHRPWPPPDGPWLMGQTWVGLLFAHWRVPKQALERVVPAQLPIDTYEGSAWLAVTPFMVRGLRLRATPPLPLLSSFPEINVRTYVTVDGRPGIYFLSLDAGSRLGVHGARLTYRLPYFHARASARSDGQRMEFHSKRISKDGPPASFRGRYGPDGDPLPFVEGSLERWLTERYCLYTFDERLRVQRGEIHHPPWQLQPASAEIATNTMTNPLDISLEGEPLLHFSARQDVVIWSIQPVAER
ncbi:MAG TPA: DUF2071 domain-containing protein [Solirubrobacterales bacterium]|jgi:uncharacterized protein YqjF (DUF2071 family)